MQCGVQANLVKRVRGAMVDVSDLAACEEAPRMSPEVGASSLLAGRLLAVFQHHSAHLGVLKGVLCYTYLRLTLLSKVFDSIYPFSMSFVFPRSDGRSLLPLTRRGAEQPLTFDSRLEWCVCSRMHRSECVQLYACCHVSQRVHREHIISTYHASRGIPLSQHRPQRRAGASLSWPRVETNVLPK